jgi:putative transposase
MSEAICGEKTERELDLLMVGYRRNFVPGGTYFFTVTLADRRLSMLVDHIDVLRSALRTARSERPFTIDAIVILPDHLHAILTLPPEDSDFSGRWRRIKGYFSSGLIDASIELVRRPNGSLALWQSRFWEHTIRDETDFARHVDYIHFNPVKHALVQRVRDWPYSSFHRYVQAGLLPDDWAGDFSEGRGDFWRTGIMDAVGLSREVIPDIASLIRATGQRIISSRGCHIANHP